MNERNPIGNEILEGTPQELPDYASAIHNPYREGIAGTTGEKEPTFASNKIGDETRDESVIWTLASKQTDGGSPPKADWRDFGYYYTDKPCCICGSTHEIGSEPRFCYTVCEEHSKLSPVEISRMRKNA
jgi:hypothetical protein